jgi:hypothetical protein
MAESLPDEVRIFKERDPKGYTKGPDRLEAGPSGVFSRERTIENL